MHADPAIAVIHVLDDLGTLEAKVKRKTATAQEYLDLAQHALAHGNMRVVQEYMERASKEMADLSAHQHRYADA